MRILIDGYNLMHAIGLMPPSFGPDGFRRARKRFLNDLAAGLDPVDAHQTTVVFDAAHPPPDRPDRERHKGLTVLYAVNDEDADARLEILIAKHSSPKQLTVVSSDRRVRDAAKRRRALTLTSDEFWERVRRPRKVSASPPKPSAEERGRREGPSAAESRFWQETFGALDQAPEMREALAEPSSEFLPSDEEIARIEREVERESG